jgi:hypothetical protein
MGTRVYGASDDLIEFEGDLSGEVSCYGTDDDGHTGVLLTFSDGTILVVKYGKPGCGGVWGITTVHAGKMLDRIDACSDEDADPHSDQAFFKEGVSLKCWAATQWEVVH